MGDAATTTEPAATEATTPTPGQPDPTPPTPPNQEPEKGTDKPGGDDKGEGSKTAVLADLAAERDKRQALEQQFTSLKDGLAKALGLGDTEKATPEQLQQQIAAAQSETTAAQTQLAVFRSAPADVDAQALLDSTSFLASLKDVKADDQAALKAAITTFVDTNPRFKTGTPGAGAHDAAAGGTHQPAAKSMDDWIRGR